MPEAAPIGPRSGREMWHDAHDPEKQPRVILGAAEPSWRELAQEALRGAGFAVHAVADGGAVMRACATPPELVVLDEALTSPEAFEVCRWLRRQPATFETPVLFLTAAGSVEAVRRAYEAGASDFATKPLDRLLFAHRALYLLRASRVVLRLRESQERLARAQRLARLAYWEWDVGRHALTLSEELADLLDDATVLATPSLERLLEIVPDADRELVQRCFREALGSGRPADVEHRVRIPGGRTRTVRHQIEVALGEEGEPTRILGAVQDITDRTEVEEEMRRLAYHDPLTGLPNRRFLSERLPVALERSAERNRYAALLLLDLDRFNRINDSFDHSIGDALLKDVAHRLLTRVRITDTVMRPQSEEAIPAVSRLGGDEFAIFLGDLGDAQDAGRVGQRVLELLARPFELGGQEVVVTASVGVAIHPVDGRDFDTLLRNADAALHHAKREGRNNLQFYTESMNATAARRLLLENRLRRAVEQDELSVHYQPKIELRMRRLAGLEALLRWRPSELGSVTPSEFVPLAEESELILSLGEWVLTKVCEQSRRWRDEGYRMVPIAVNLSARELGDPGLPVRARRIVEAAGLLPDAVEFEVTESAIMRNEEAAVRALRALKHMGFSLALDDFGTGYSSLTYLRRFPIDVLKIDRSFVRNVAHNPGDAAIVAAIIAMARNLKLTVVAEGVETEEQEVFLYATGCDQLQGFRMGPPLGAHECRGYLVRGGSCAA